MPDCLIVGGGVIGLSIAYELARSGRSVQLIERGALGREASWAGAGILPPPATAADLPAWKRLLSISHNLHRQWCEQLRRETGIDNGYRRCGGIHLARAAGEAAALKAEMQELAADGVRVEALPSPEQLGELEPNLSLAADGASPIQAAFTLPDEAQIRNPDHLRALAASCRALGVAIQEDTEANSFRIHAGRIVDVNTTAGTFAADHVILTAGAWSQTLLEQVGLSLSVYPVRGQMVLYRCPRPLVRRIINEGPRYIVPRDDGRVLVGSTEEDVGFDKRTTEKGIAELREFAERLLPTLRESPVEKTWAGLRPHAVDGFPYIGRVPHVENCLVAAGHYRSGLTASTGTAVLIRQLLDGERTICDAAEFRLDR